MDKQRSMFTIPRPNPSSKDWGREDRIKPQGRYREIISARWLAPLLISNALDGSSSHPTIFINRDG
jgi:hypothetical protein